MHPLTRHSLTIVAACCLILLGGEGGIAKTATFGMRGPPLQRALPPVPRGSSTRPITSSSRRSRVVQIAPNGDVFVADRELDTVDVLHIPAGGAGPAQRQIFARGLRQPFGIAFYPAGPDPRWVYVAARDGVVRFAYKNGDLKANGSPERIVSGIPTTHYARLEPFGATMKVAATGPQSCEDMTVQPATGELWCIGTKRDERGDESPADASPADMPPLGLQPM